MKKRLTAIFIAFCVAFATGIQTFAAGSDINSESFSSEYPVSAIVLQNTENDDSDVSTGDESAAQMQDETVTDDSDKTDAEEIQESGESGGQAGEQTDEQTGDQAGEQTGENSGEDTGSSNSSELDERLPWSSSYVRPNDYMYLAFNQLIDLYVKEHLYEFTREEALEKFLYDIIKQHPEYYDMYLNTLLGTMDDYSAYHDSSSGFLSVESPNAGFGIVIEDTGSEIVITKVLKQSTAEAAGILPGDVIKSVMGIDVTGLPWFTVSEMLRKPYAYLSQKGEDGKYLDYNPAVPITVERNGQIIEFSIHRGVMITDELTYKYFEEEGVAYIAISSFLGETLADDFNALVADISSKGIKKLVIDLRDNGGGSFDLVTKMSETFVDEGEVMFYVNEKEYEKPEPVVSTTPKTEFDSISVLVNGYTASAAELMASILRNKADAVLVGNTTYGKALGQSVYSFAAGGYITITTYEILDSNGESYNGKGLEPELVIDNVQMLYDFPSLPIFNHVNYKEITPGVYNDACLALEKRLEMMGYLRPESVDGIWDDNTKTAIYVLQRTYFAEGSGMLDDRTVTLITDLINSYKTYTYYEDSQLDVALLYHSSFSQAKRLIAEKQTLAKRQQTLIEENREYYENLDA